ARFRAQPVLGLQVLPIEVALRVNHRLRLARGAARERDQAWILGRQVDGGGTTEAASSSARLRSSTRIREGLATANRRRRSFARSCSVQGSTTAPMRKQAHIAITHSGRLPISVITTSPL